MDCRSPGLEAVLRHGAHSGRSKRVGCTNSVVDWIRPVCSKIVFMYPTGTEKASLQGILMLEALHYHLDRRDSAGNP